GGGRPGDQAGDRDERPARRDRLRREPGCDGVADGAAGRRQLAGAVRARQRPGMGGSMSGVELPRSVDGAGRAAGAAARQAGTSRHVRSLLVEDKPGLLTRVAGLFARRGFNIESLAVGHTEIEGLSRITVVVDVDEVPLEQVTKQLNKLINVIKIVELDPENSVQREDRKSTRLNS